MPSIRDLPRSDELNEMIARGCWNPGKSRWREFQSAIEAAMLTDETIVRRGTNWLMKAVSLGKSSGVFYEWLPYTDEFSSEREVSYKELFRYAKISDGSIPCGVPNGGLLNG